LKIPKRSIVISNTNKDNFVQALAYQSDQEPEILFMSSKEYGKTSISGDLLTSKKALEDIKQFINRPLFDP
jgi:hypothetical protein